VSSHPHLQSLGKRPFGEAALQPSHNLFLQLATMESSSNFNMRHQPRPRKKDLLSRTVKNDSISHQGRSDQSRYGWIYLLSAIAKNNSISYQSRRGPSGYGWIHLLSAIVKNNSISHQFRRGTSRYDWIHSQTAIVKDDSISYQYRRDHPDTVRFTYVLQ
jgi:hypothetical protein